MKKQAPKKPAASPDKKQHKAKAGKDREGLVHGILPPKTVAGLASAGDPENPRAMTEKARGHLSASLDEFGDLSGIVYNRRTGQLVSGHQRTYDLAQKYGPLPLTELPGGGYAIVTPKGDVFPVRVVSWDAKKQRAANMAANNQALAGTFTDLLPEQLEGLRADDAGMFAALAMDALVVEVDEGKTVTFKAFDENMDTQHECPKCRYSWSGSSKPIDKTA